jgi:hypothetical protein
LRHTSLQQLSSYVEHIEPLQRVASVVVLSLIGALLLYFFYRFVGPAVAVYRSLRSTRKQVAIALQIPDGDASALQVLDKIFEREKAHSAWQAYKKTFIPKKEPDETGLDRIIEWYTGTPAGACFTTSALIEFPLHTEFFKHLPGILTGLGITGTFVGIILGLTGVDLGADQQKTLEFLNKLMRAVGSAFGVSFVAIFCATIVTLFEKFLLAEAISELSKLENLLDQFFNKDLTDEYLARLVAASEISATQMKHLKESLVSDLKVLLDKLALSNSDSLKAQTKDLSSSIAESIKTSLNEPIGLMTETVKSLSMSNSEGMSTMFMDMMTRFANQFEAAAGKQNSELSRILQENTTLIRGVAADFMKLTGSLKDAGKDAATAMTDEIQKVLRTLADQQQATANAMNEFAHKFQSSLAESQDDVRVKQESLMIQLSTAVEQSLNHAQSQGRVLADEQRLQQSTFNEAIGRATNALGEALDLLIERNTKAITSLEENVSVLSNVTVSAINGIERGASKLQDATLGLADAGEELTKTFTLAGTSTSEIVRSAVQLTRATEIIDKSINTSESVASLFSKMAIDLRQTVETAKRDASVTADLVTTIERAAEKIRDSGQVAEEYLEKVNLVLTEAHRAFASSAAETQKSMSQRFHKDLADAVALLGGSVTDLRTQLDALNDIR